MTVSSAMGDAVRTPIFLRPQLLRGCLLSLLAALSSANLTAEETVPMCASDATGAPMQITADCVDPYLSDPYIDVDEWRQTPVPHRYVHGGFNGTDGKFAFYFPPAEQFEGRFFQYTHQFQTSEELEQSTPGEINPATGSLEFAADSGGYWVQTNGLGVIQHPTAPPSIKGYRLNAAAAKLAKTFAREMYGVDKIYGYLYGGSGGAYQTVAAAENTTGVWDGTVPFVMGVPNSIPSALTIRTHALRILKKRDRFPGIVDALAPGGSGDPYADLNEEERATLLEVENMGFPLRGWWNHETLDGGAFSYIVGPLEQMDPGYPSDFWSQPGYLGTDPASTIADDRIQHPTVIAAAVPLPAPFGYGVVLADPPPGSLQGSKLIIESGAAAGQVLSLFGDLGGAIGFQIGTDPAILSSLQAGDQVRVDNSAFLAFQTYQRHQVPADTSMHAWDQYRDDNGGTLYPQRPFEVGPVFAFNSAGAIQTGNFHGKMIVVQNMMDIDAFPWMADWYRSKVQAANPGDDIRHRFRLWMNDNAKHTSPTADDYLANANTIVYVGILQQALRDVAAWVEQGIEPPASSRYRVAANNQVSLPKYARQRKGIQPVVRLKANGRESITVSVNQPVHFSALVSAPPGAGKVVAVEWDYLGEGSFPQTDKLKKAKCRKLVRGAFRYTQPGTYFPLLRVTSQRESDADTPFARIQNLARVRVVVK